MLENLFKQHWISAFSTSLKAHSDTGPSPLINWITGYVFSALKINRCGVKMHPIAFLVFLTQVLKCCLCRLLNWECVRLNNSILDYITSQYIIPSFMSLLLLDTLCSHPNNMIMGLIVLHLVESYLVYLLFFQSQQRTNLSTSTAIFIYFSLSLYDF